MAAIKCERLTKRYPDGTVAVRQLDLEVADGELLVLVGPSGCGKTTLLRMIAGLEEISEGTIRIGDRVVNGVHPRDRDIAMVFQSYALYPQMTVYDNIGFSLKLRGAHKREIDSAVRSTAAKLGLTELLERRPRQLSGGQRQRVAMGRAIVRAPQVFLLDEPLSNLDAKLRTQVRGEIGELQRELGVTSVYVTHDQVEAVTLGHRVAAMRDGVIQQLGTPRALYQRPANLFVAGFIGSPAMNLLEAIVDGDEAATWLRCGSHRLACPDSLSATLRAYHGRRVALGIRPESLEDAAYASGAPPDHELQVVVDRREEISADTYLYFELDAQPVVTADIRDVSADVDASALRDLELRRQDRRAACIARADARSRAREGARITLTVDIEAMRVFDLDTGMAITNGANDDESQPTADDQRQSARSAL